MINTYVAVNWKSFASQVVPLFVVTLILLVSLEFVSLQNYFDKHGVFMCTVVSVPLLIMSGFMVIMSTSAFYPMTDISNFRPSTACISVAGC